MLIKKDILAALAYFDLFDYPITQREISLFLKNSYKQEQIEAALSDLVAERVIYPLEECYSLQDNPLLWRRRRQGNEKAIQMLRVASTVTRVLSAFPFVRGVAISGSLSKNFADEDSDIDLFIITSKNRLWVARTLLHAVKKISYLFNRQHWFCMNYFVDEAILEIKEKNIYTAIEVATLMPLRGAVAFNAFYESNKWVAAYLPNHTRDFSLPPRPATNSIKRGFEYLIDNAFGNRLDDFLMQLTAKRWHKKEQQRKKNMRGITMSMDASKHCAKPAPTYFQKQLISKYESKLADVFSQMDLALRPACQH
jgi:hypothetical protein